MSNDEMIPGARVRTSLSIEAPEAAFLGDRTGVIVANDMKVNGAVLGDPVIGMSTGDVWVQIDPDSSGEPPLSELSSIYAFRLSELALITDAETSDDGRG